MMETANLRGMKLRSTLRLSSLFGALIAGAALVAGCSDTLSTRVGDPPPPATASVTPVTRNEIAQLPPIALEPAPDQPGSPSPTGSGPGASNTGPVKIGLILPLGGFDQTAQIAKGMKQAAEMALFEAQRPNVQLIVKDDKGTADGARAATDEAIKEGAEIVLGPLFAKSVAGAAPAARAANVPLMTFSNDRQIAGPGVYAMGFSPAQDAEAIAAYALRQNKTRFASLVADDGYGQVIAAAFRQAVDKAGGVVVASETYPAGANAMIGPARRIAEAIKAGDGAGKPIDAVFVPGGADVIPQLGPLLAYAGFNTGRVKLLGSGAWEFASIGNNDTFVGGWYPGPDPQGWRSFSDRFVKAFGTPPPRLASVAYDCVTLALSLSSEDKDRRFTAANLTRPSGFNGVDGTLRLSSAGTVDRELAILEVRKMGAVVLEPGTASLQGAKVSAMPPPPARVN